MEAAQTDVDTCGTHVYPVKGGESSNRSAGHNNKLSAGVSPPAAVVVAEPGYWVSPSAASEQCRRAATRTHCGSTGTSLARFLAHHPRSLDGRRGRGASSMSRSAARAHGCWSAFVGGVHQNQQSRHRNPRHPPFSHCAPNPPQEQGGKHARNPTKQQTRGAEQLTIRRLHPSIAPPRRQAPLSPLPPLRSPPWVPCGSQPHRSSTTVPCAPPSPLPPQRSPPWVYGQHFDVVADC